MKYNIGHKFLMWGLKLLEEYVGSSRIVVTRSKEGTMVRYFYADDPAPGIEVGFTRLRSVDIANEKV